MTEKPWYVEFFDEDYLRVHRPYLTAARTQEEVIGILKMLNLPAGSQVLDLACGHGRHAIPLAAVIYKLTGLDRSRLFLDRAQALARDVETEVAWVRGEMRALPFGGGFDAVINIFNTFGYLENELEDLKVLDEVARVLRPGGAFLLETINRDGLLRNFLPSDVDHHEDGLLVMREQSFDPLTSRLNVVVTLIEPNGARREHRQSVRFYTLTELADMLGTAGLRIESYNGGLDASPLTMNSLRLVILARKMGMSA